MMLFATRSSRRVNSAFNALISPHYELAGTKLGRTSQFRRRLKKRSEPALTDERINNANPLSSFFAKELARSSYKLVFENRPPQLTGMMAWTIIYRVERAAPIAGRH
jgi:hypothetical protein